MTRRDVLPIACAAYGILVPCSSLCSLVNILFLVAPVVTFKNSSSSPMYAQYCGYSHLCSESL